MNIKREYWIPKKRHDELKSFIKYCNKESGTVDMLRIESIPGVDQDPFVLIRYTYDTSNIDDYGRPIKGTRFTVMYDDRMIGDTGAEKVGYFEPDDYVYIYTDRGSILLYGVSDINVHFTKRYRDEVLMRLLKLMVVNEGHKNEYEIMVKMIEEINKE